MWLIYTEPNEPYVYSFDASVLPHGKLRHRLASNPLMFHVFTSEALAQEFIVYIKQNHGIYCTYVSLTRERLLAEFVRLQSRLPQVVEWFCVDERLGIGCKEGVGRPFNIKEYSVGIAEAEPGAAPDPAT
jgi:hypothetical protein